ncbi:MAG TPA: hypothetical protein EYP67_07875 [Methanosarcinales archaeon]|nr:hypothetical protein [Methanosarcinales archaeon]
MALSDVHKRQIEDLLRGRGLHGEKLAILCRYDEDLRIEQKSLARQYNILQVIHRLGVDTGINYRDLTKDDLKSWLATLDNLKTSSMSTYQVIVKQFFKWLYGLDDDYPDIVRWIKPPNVRKQRKIPTDLITPDDVKALIDAADHPRDRALVALIYESACRVGEIMTLDVKDLTFDQYGAVIVVDGKTGMCRVQLIMTSPYLSQWIDQHPLHDRTAPLFVSFANSNYGARMSEDGVRSTLKTLAKRAGIEKHVYPHLFRHSHLTELAGDFTEQQLKIIAGWAGDSRMVAIYVHLSGTDVDKKMLEKVGLLDREESEDAGDALKPKNCPRCRETNPATAQLSEHSQNQFLQCSDRIDRTGPGSRKCFDFHPEIGIRTSEEVDCDRLQNLCACYEHVLVDIEPARMGRIRLADRNGRSDEYIRGERVPVACPRESLHQRCDR